MKISAAVLFPLICLSGCAQEPPDIQRNTTTHVEVSTATPPPAPPQKIVTTVAPPAQHSTVSVSTTTATLPVPVPTTHVKVTVPDSTAVKVAPDSVKVKQTTAVAVHDKPVEPSSASIDPLVNDYLGKLSGHFSALPQADLKEAASNNAAARAAVEQGKVGRARELVKRNQDFLNHLATRYSVMPSPAAGDDSATVDKATAQLRILKLAQAETALVAGMLEQSAGDTAGSSADLKTAAEMPGFPPDWEMGAEVTQMQSDANSHMK